MATKLTLTLEEKVIASAKKYATRRGKSLSKIVESYLKTISLNDSSEKKLLPRVAKLKGVIQLPKNFEYKNELAKAIAEKHSK